MSMSAGKRGAGEGDSGRSQMRTCGQGQPPQGLVRHAQELLLPPRNRGPPQGMKQYSPGAEPSALGAIVFTLQSARRPRKV